MKCNGVTRTSKSGWHTNGNGGSWSKNRHGRKSGEKLLGIVIPTLLIFVLSLISSAPLSFANTSKGDKKGISEETAINCIVGEASNQGYIGMIAVAEVMRKRGSTKGLYGCKRKDFALSQPKYVRELAKEAWRVSAFSNFTASATHFENVKAFGEPKWAKNMTKTAEIHDHVFFKGAA